MNDCTKLQTALCSTTHSTEISFKIVPREHSTEQTITVQQTFRKQFITLPPVLGISIIEIRHLVHLQEISVDIILKTLLLCHLHSRTVHKL